MVGMRLMMFSMFPDSFRAGTMIETEGVLEKVLAASINGLATATFKRQKFLKKGNGAKYLLKKWLTPGT